MCHLQQPGGGLVLNGCAISQVPLCGSEVDILADGSLDFSDDVLAELDIVIASVHTAVRQSREQSELPDELPGGDPIEAESLAILDVVRKLPDAYRDTLLMRLVEGMSGAEIAERTGLTPGSVRVNLHRGMMILRERLGSLGERP